VTTRILLHAFPPLDGDMLKRLFGAQPDMAVVAEVGDREDLVAAVREWRADVVIASARASELSDACRRLLAESTRLRVLTFAPPAASAVFELRTCETALGDDMSAKGLVETIRGVGS
jgi:hypothetical protein